MTVNLLTNGDFRTAKADFLLEREEAGQVVPAEGWVADYDLSDVAGEVGEESAVRLSALTFLDAQQAVGFSDPPGGAMAEAALVALWRYEDNAGAASLSVAQTLLGGARALAAHPADFSFWVWAAHPGEITFSATASVVRQKALESPVTETVVVSAATERVSAGWNFIKRSVVPPKIASRDAFGRIVVSDSLRVSFDLGALATLRSLVLTGVALDAAVEENFDLAREFAERKQLLGLPASAVWVDAAAGDDATGKRGYSKTPFATVAAACAAAVAGDTIYVGPGTFVETLPVVVPAGSKLVGAGRGVTEILSGVFFSASGPAITFAGDGVLAGLSVKNTTRTVADTGDGSKYEAAVGVKDATTSASIVIRDVDILAGVYGVFLSGAACSLTVDSCRVEANAFSVYVAGNHAVVVRNSELVALGPTKAHSTDTAVYNRAVCVLVADGAPLVRVLDCTLDMDNTVGGTVSQLENYLRLVDGPNSAPGVFEFIGCRLLCDSSTFSNAFMGRGVSGGEVLRVVGCQAIGQVSIHSASGFGSGSVIEFGRACAGRVELGTQSTSTAGDSTQAPHITAVPSTSSAPPSAYEAGSLALITGNGSAQTALGVKIGGGWYKVNLTGLVTAWE